MLFRKMLRDMRLQKAQFLSVFLMIFVGLFVFAGMSAEGDGMRKSSEDYYKETNLADAIIYGQGVTSEDVEAVIKQAGISGVERRAQLDVNWAGDKDVVLSLNAVEAGKISSMEIISGEKYSSQKSGVWLDCMFADSHDLKSGDVLRLITPYGNMNLTIRGLVMQPEYIYAIKDESQILPDHKGYGYAFISGKKYPQITDAAYSQLLVAGNTDKNTLEKCAAEYVKAKNSIVLMQKEFPGQAMFTNEIEQQKAVQIAFPAAFLLIALLTMITAMTRMTAKQRTQIGTLKAVGVTARKIYAHYLAYAILPVFSGGVLGTVAGCVLLPKLMFRFQSEFYAIPTWRSHVSANVYIAIVICVFICGSAGFLACQKEVSQVAADILRPKMPKPVRPRNEEKSGWWSSKSFRVQWNTRDIMRNKMRSFITVAGVSGCMMLIVCALGLSNTIDGLIVWMYEDINTYETKVILDEKEDCEQIIDRAEYVQESQAEVKISGNKSTENMIITDTGTGSFVEYTDKERNYIALPDSGMAMTYKTAELLKVKKGEIIKWKPYGSDVWVESKVNTIIRTPLAQGIYMKKDVYESAGFSMRPTAFLTDRKAAQFADGNYKSVQSKKEIIEDMNTMLETMNVIIKILIIAAIFLGIVVLYNLGVLSFAEKERDLATLKVLGFKDKKLKSLLAMQNIWLTVSGIIVGLPLGYFLLTYMLRFMGDTMDMMPVIYGYSYTMSAVGIFILSGVINYLMNQKIKNIKMVEALKGTE